MFRRRTDLILLKKAGVFWAAGPVVGIMSDRIRRSAVAWLSCSTIRLFTGLIPRTIALNLYQFLAFSADVPLNDRPLSGDLSKVAQQNGGQLASQQASDCVRGNSVEDSETKLSTSGENGNTTSAAVARGSGVVSSGLRSKEVGVGPASQKTLVLSGIEERQSSLPNSRSVPLETSNADPNCIPHRPPRALNLAAKIQDLRAKGAGMVALEGEIWTVLPRSGFTQLYLEGADRAIPNTKGVTSGGQYTANDFESASVEWLKVRIGRDGIVRRVEPRSGVVLTASLLASTRRALVVPGKSKGDRQSKFQQLVDFSSNAMVRRSVGRSKIYYDYASMWSVDVADLIYRRSCLNLGSDADWPRSNPLERAKAFVRYLLGLSGLKQDKRASSASLILPGELVFVRFSPGFEDEPCLVISPLELNAQNRLVVLSVHVTVKKIDVTQRRDIIELELDAALRSCSGLRQGQRLLVDLAMIRGIKSASQFVRRLNPPLSFADDHVWTRIVSSLDRLYFNG